MKHIPLFLALNAVLLLSIQSASATVYNYTISASGIPASGAGVTYDNGGSAPVDDLLTGDPGSSSLITAITGTTGNKYSALSLNVDTLFDTTGLTIADLSGISFNYIGTATNDWQLSIYTNQVAGDTSFYNDRFTGLSIGASSTWATSNADTAGYFTLVTNKGGGYTGSISDSLTDLGSNATYGPEQIQYLYLEAGASGNSSVITDNLDGITLTRANGDVVNIDFIPEPSTVALEMVGFVALGFMAYRCRIARASSLQFVGRA